MAICKMRDGVILKCQSQMEAQPPIVNLFLHFVHALSVLSI